MSTIEEEEKKWPLPGNDLLMENEEAYKLSVLRKTEKQNDDWLPKFLKMPK